MPEDQERPDEEQPDDLLPVLDDEPEEWGPDHDELVERVTQERGAEAIIAEGNRQGDEIDPDDDEDNGLSDQDEGADE